MTVSVGLSGLGLRGAGSVRGRRFSDLGVLEQLRSLMCYDVSPIRRAFPFAQTHFDQHSENVFEIVARTHSNTEWDLPTNAYESH